MAEILAARRGDAAALEWQRLEAPGRHDVWTLSGALVERDGEWHIVRMFDNAHSPDEHHEHRYVGAEKQEPIVTGGPVNDAMHAVEVKLRGGWSDIVRSWENTR